MMSLCVNSFSSASASVIKSEVAWMRVPSSRFTLFSKVTARTSPICDEEEEFACKR